MLLCAMAKREPFISPAYHAAIAREIRVLAAAEERTLLQRWQTQQDLVARDRVVTAHLRFVVRQARRHTRDAEQAKDFIAAGNVGLVKAANTFDYAREPYVRFLSYAGWWVYAEMAKHGYATATPVYVPAERQQRQRRDVRAQALANRNMPQEAPLPAYLEGTTLSLDDVPEHLAALHVAAPSHEQVRLRALVRQGIAQLTPREQTVVNLAFGMKDDPRSLSQIATLLMLGPERVRQIKLRALQKLQALWKASPTAPTPER